jgi:hypothetical protein
VAGSFAFTTPSAAPNGGTANQSVTFTPTDNANYNTTTTNVSVTVNQANQTITFGALANKTTADAPFSLTATASSSLTVSYSSSNTAVATVAGSTVTIVGAGQTTITASQAGDGNYNAATSVDQTLTVTQKIAGWDFNSLSGYGSSPQAATNSDANITVGGLTRASGFETGGTAASNAWGGTGNGTATFTVKANSGYTLSLSEISAYNIRRSGTGSTTGQWAYSLDGTNFTNIGSAITWGNTTTSSGNSQSAISLIGISALQNLSDATTVTFRIVNTGGTTGTWYLNNFQTGDDFIIQGYVKSVPQLSTPTAASISTSSATLGATVTSDGGAAITDYEYSLNGAPYISAGRTTSPFTITGLNGRTAYSVTIKARNSVGLSTASSSLSATTTDSSRDTSEAAAAEAARVAAANAAAEAAKKQKELTELLSVIPSIAGLTLNLGDLTNKLLFKQKCVKGTKTKYVKKVAKCPKGYVRKK